MFYVNFWIYSHFSSTLIWLRDEEGRIEKKKKLWVALSFSLYAIILSMDGWLIQRNPVSRKGCDKVPWSFLLFRIPLLSFCLSVKHGLSGAVSISCFSLSCMLSLPCVHLGLCWTSTYLEFTVILCHGPLWIWCMNAMMSDGGRQKNSYKTVIKLLRLLSWGAWLSQSMEHTTLDLEVVSPSPPFGAEITYVNQT